MIVNVKKIRMMLLTVLVLAGGSLSDVYADHLLTAHGKLASYSEVIPTLYSKDVVAMALLGLEEKDSAYFTRVLAEIGDLDHETLVKLVADKEARNEIMVKQAEEEASKLMPAYFETEEACQNYIEENSIDISEGVIEELQALIEAMGLDLERAYELFERYNEYLVENMSDLLSGSCNTPESMSEDDVFYLKAFAGILHNHLLKFHEYQEVTEYIVTYSQCTYGDLPKDEL